MTRIVVLGGGFGGIETMLGLERRLGGRADVELLLVSDTNYLLFTPLLPQVASSLVEPRHIIQPIRDLRGSRRFRFRRDRVIGVDLGGRRLHLAEGEVPYDRLVLALGGVTPTFGIPGVETHALNYKGLEDAVRLRDHVIDLAEHADHEPDPAVRRRMLTICVVGGGYTGVELVAELQDFFESYLVPRYRGIEHADYRLLLVEAGREILRGVHPTLAARAQRSLRREGIEVRTQARVTRVLANGVELEGGETIPAGLTIWVAGVKGHPELAGLPVERDRIGRLIVDEHLRLPGYPEVFGVGDDHRAGPARRLDPDHPRGAGARPPRRREPRRRPGWPSARVDPLRAARHASLPGRAGRRGRAHGAALPWVSGLAVLERATPLQAGRTAQAAAGGARLGVGPLVPARFGHHAPAPELRHLPCAGRAPAGRGLRPGGAR
jgi:NADH dehydrogenase FAD-containing subunit